MFALVGLESLADPPTAGGMGARVAISFEISHESQPDLAQTPERRNRCGPKFQRSFSGVSAEFQRSFSGISAEFQRSLVEAFLSTQE
eukprot:14306464-Alexandrium_andersonii.AAC.1